MNANPNETSPRIVVIGSSCAGKSTFARALAQSRGCAHIEMDDLFWSAGWRPKPAPEFRRLVAEAAVGERWVADGNYSSARDLLWPRATTVVWLDLGLPRVLWRGLWRCLGRALGGRPLWHGNRESLRRMFLSKDSLLLWIVTTFHRRRREFAQLRDSRAFAHLTWLETRDPGEARALLRDLQAWQPTDPTTPAQGEAHVPIP
jgi:adenylate kinase family enzyme